MNDIVVLCLTVLFSVAFLAPAGAQRSLPPRAGSEPCVAAEGDDFSIFVTAIVSKVDLRRERATLETSVGRLELAAAAAELAVLQPGDVLTLCVDPTALSGTRPAAPTARG